jgi:hypothetical protein
MKRSRLKWMTIIGATLLVAGLVPAWSAEEMENAAPAPGVEVAPPELGSCDYQDAPVLEETAQIIKPKPPGGGCLGSVVQTCDDVPIPVGGTCSCQSVLLDDKCRNCDTRKKGKVLETTCTVCPRCWTPPCDFMQCNDFTSRTCSEI